MSKQAALVRVLAKLTLACLVSLVSSELEIDLQRIEQNYGEHLVDARELRVRKINRTSHALNGTVRVAVDLDNEFRVSLSLAHSRLGNNQFNIYPMKIPEQASCVLMNGSYREYQSLLLDHSNMPQVPPEGMCPFRKGTYWFKDAIFSSTYFPPYVPEGYWRFTFEYLGPIVNNASFSLYAQMKNTNIWS
ncbi:uncharacterized protein LOC119770835 [Culex quinquefasciatus]|uniref:uncharacterized protein LOC119770835 n=1 Tax=Culex quinquefasciatus TaxID=7176 RepID=UPI0018E2CB11|nr:uncharacterized protein LOC119770835 [Culex quinquefasciatus]